jgi:hypothetical protein
MQTPRERDRVLAAIVDVTDVERQRRVRGPLRTVLVARFPSVSALPMTTTQVTRASRAA